MMKWIISWNSYIQNMMKIFCMLTYRYSKLDCWSPFLKNIYIVFTVLFHKDEGENVAVTNCMSHFSMFVPTKANVKMSNGNTGHAQGIEIILCLFPNCSTIYPVGPVYYFPVHPSNTISSGALKFYAVFKGCVYLLIWSPCPHSLLIIGWWCANPREAAMLDTRLCPS